MLRLPSSKLAHSQHKLLLCQKLMIKDLNDKVVLVTGSSTGIGAAIAKAFAANGSKVAVHYNSSKNAAEEVVSTISNVGGVARAFQADVCETTQTEKMIAETVNHFGRIDILINNAGGMVKRARLAETDDTLFDQMLNLNARSVLTACRAVIPHFNRQGGGAIINTTSIVARRGGGVGAGLYAASKSFVHNLTRNLALEFAMQGIRVNAVAPGIIDTPFYDSVSTPEMLENLRKTVPMGRLGKPEDLTGAYLFLASESLSGYMTGQVLEVNGGLLMP
jgi:3-oxoacyl-[acyl-carrier protein] reductase